MPRAIRSGGNSLRHMSVRGQPEFFECRKKMIVPDFVGPASSSRIDHASIIWLYRCVVAITAPRPRA